MSLQIIKGDIFISNANYLVCPVNCEGVMGKGLAKEFKKRFPYCDESYKILCKNNLPILYDIGDYHYHDYAHYYKQGFGHNILFFATKKERRKKSNLIKIRNGLICFVKDNRDRPDIKYAFPSLGCGEGGLNWLDIKAIFEEVFQDCENLIELYEPIN